MVSAMARTKVVLPTPPLAFITVMLFPIGCCSPPKAEATPAPHIDNGATKENLWRAAPQDRASAASARTKPALLRGGAAGISDGAPEVYFQPRAHESDSLRPHNALGCTCEDAAAVENGGVGVDSI